MLAKGDRWGWGGRDCGFGIGTCTLRYMEWLANRDLLYSTGNSTQYSVMVYMGKEKNGCVSLHNWITLLYRRNYHPIVNQPYFNTPFKYEKKWNKIKRSSHQIIKSLGISPREAMHFQVLLFLLRKKIPLSLVNTVHYPVIPKIICRSLVRMQWWSPLICWEKGNRASELCYHQKGSRMHGTELVGAWMMKTKIWIQLLALLLDTSLTLAKRLDWSTSH